jgi:DNA-binding protein YbaB
MKLSTASLLLVLSTASAFAPIPTPTQQSTRLNLFGGGKSGGEKKGPGMMDQLAMFKKAQELATKKNKLDQELATMEFAGTGADGKVKAAFKFVPVTNPMDPNPDYEAVSFDFDEEWYEAASPEELSAAVKEAIDSGIEDTNKAVQEKYQVLQGDLMGAFQQTDEEAPAS